MNMNSPRERRTQVQGRGRLRERFREETAAAVLEAAEDVFVEKGLHAASMGDIARRAGVAVGTLYNHFADRDALLNVLLDTRSRELLAEVDAELKKYQRGTFVDQLMAFVSTLFRGKEK